MYSASETQIYKAHVSSNNGKEAYAFQRVNKNSNGTTTFVTVKGEPNDLYSVLQVTKDKYGRINKRVYQMGSEYIPSLMSANKDELANDLTKVVKKTTEAKKRSTTKAPKKRSTTTKKKTTAKKKTTSKKKTAKTTTPKKRSTTAKTKTTTTKKKKSSGILGWFS